jgi:hypothetical protein
MQNAKDINNHRRWGTYVLSGGLVVVGIVFVVICLIFGGMDGDMSLAASPPPDPEMERLIGNLARAYRPAVKFMDMNIRSDESDDRFRNEVKAQGRRIVPYLIEGLHHRNVAVRRECAWMLAEIPSKEGLCGLIETLGSKHRRDPPLFSVNQALWILTGDDNLFELSGGVLETDLTTMRKVWLPWWEDNKERIVDMEKGIGLRQDDGTVTPMGSEEEPEATKKPTDGKQGVPDAPTPPSR